jgi:predicted amidophosphoribosyltransferase
MSMIPRCSRCDAKLDPYGRDGGHAWCLECLAEHRELLALRDAECGPDPLPWRDVA